MTYFQPMIAVPQSQAENVIACHSSFDEFCCSETTFYFLKVKMQNSKKIMAVFWSSFFDQGDRCHA